MPLFPRPLPNSPSYSYGLVDTAGVASANNFLSVFNPANSGVVHFPLAIGLSCYSIAQVQVANSMVAYRTTAASSGTLVSTSDLNKFQTTLAAPKCEMRTSNPTVTTLNTTPIVFKAPIVSGTGGGNSGTVEVTAPIQGPLAFALLPGEGLVFTTAAGDTDERWNLIYSWAESTS